MEIHQLTSLLSVSAQLNVQDLDQVVAAGFKTVICNRPDQEGEDQPGSDEIAVACEKMGINWHYQPVKPRAFTDEQALQFGQLLEEVAGPVLAFCRTGTRCTNLWALSQAGKTAFPDVLHSAKEAGYDLTKLADRFSALAATQTAVEQASVAQSEQSQAVAEESAITNSAAMCGSHDVVIVGGGAGGQAVAASLLKRQPNLDIAIVEPSAEHYYQPGWTMVGGGIFQASDTVRDMLDVMPEKAKWYQTSVTSFVPEQQVVVLSDGELLGYKYLVVAPGLNLDWGAIEGLEEALGSNGVTSNYRYDLAPYTWQLVQKTRSGTAIFTQPPMPIKCAGAPQKAMYLACSEWLDKACLSSIKVEFCNAGPGLFGVADYVPALMEYINKYKIELGFSQNLIKVDGPNQVATFVVTDADGNKSEVEKSFDMLHVCPVQSAPAFIRDSPLSDAAGWLDLDSQTMQHKQYQDIFGLGDISNTANAKTAAAVRKQAPVVAENLLSAMNSQAMLAVYSGYGSCPLTVERGKIVLAEFGYGGKLEPSFPTWLIEGKRPSKLSWFLKEKILPWVYWNLMLKGKEWLAAPQRKGE
ncbi:MAG: hypothetical protein OFPI_20990 [Osedax symbiont Rs2]|nr:MAG: hypothetical protein OFPI_20990 [Osedax symbiont Rs2]